MPQFDVTICADFNGVQTYRVKAKNAAAALKAVKENGQAFKDAECVEVEIECETLHREDVAINDVSEVEAEDNARRERTEMDLKPLHEIVKPGVPCEVECRDTYLFRCRYDGETFDSVISFIEGIRPIWRLAPPAPLLTWESDPESFVAGKYRIWNMKDGSDKPWALRIEGVRLNWWSFATRTEAEQWAEAHARANGAQSH